MFALERERSLEIQREVLEMNFESTPSSTQIKNTVWERE